MPTILSTHADEQSTYVVTAAFTDENGDAVVPNSIVWSLTDEDGVVVNSREDEAVGSPAASIDIVLKGADLKVTGTADVVRVVTVEATYTSDLGANLPLKGAARFVIDNLVAVSSSSSSSSSSSTS